MGFAAAATTNIIAMIGAGPFLTIPLLLQAMHGPQAMLGWLVGAVIAIADGLVWAELGAAMPRSGGGYQYLLEAYGSSGTGRLMSFLFLWSMVTTMPLLMASGAVGFAHYAGYIWTGLTPGGMLALAAAVGVINIALLYRRITSIAAITFTLWVGTLITTAAVVATGALHFDRRVAFDFPPGAFTFSIGFLFGLGAASRIAVYDYLGYYDVCYIGDEVKDPGRVIPRSIVISTAAVAALYLAINLSIIGVVPWRDFVPAAASPTAQFVVSVFMEKIYGSKVASVFTLMILWTAFGSVFALLLGYSRIPYAAARDGYFLESFGRLHPTGGFPHVSLLVLGALSIAGSFFALDLVIDALIATRIVVQFMGQIGGVVLLRRRVPALPRPFRIWLYPVPVIVAGVGWLFIFSTTGAHVMVFGLGALALGVLCFLGWSLRLRQWPFSGAVS